MTAQQLMDRLFEIIAHGDEIHRVWLREKLQAFVPILEGHLAPAPGATVGTQLGAALAIVARQRVPGPFDDLEPPPEPGVPLVFTEDEVKGWHEDDT